MCHISLSRDACVSHIYVSHMSRHMRHIYTSLQTGPRVPVETLDRFSTETLGRDETLDPRPTCWWQTLSRDETVDPRPTTSCLRVSRT